MKLLVNSSVRYEIMDHSRYTAINYLNNEKTQAANHSKLFKKLHREHRSLWSWKNHCTDWAQTANHCDVFHTSFWKTWKVCTKILFFGRTLWRRQVWGVENGHRFAVSCSCPEGTGRLYADWNENRKQKNQRNAKIVSQLTESGKFFSERVVSKTGNLLSESLRFSKMSSFVERCYVYVTRSTAATMLLRKR